MADTNFLTLSSQRLGMARHHFNEGATFPKPGTGLKFNECSWPALRLRNVNVIPRFHFLPFNRLIIKMFLWKFGDSPAEQGKDGGHEKDQDF